MSFFKLLILLVVGLAGVAGLAWIVHRIGPGLSWEDYLKILVAVSAAWCALFASVLTFVGVRLGHAKDVGIERGKQLHAEQMEHAKIAGSKRVEAIKILIGTSQKLATTMHHDAQSKYDPIKIQPLLDSTWEATSEISFLFDNNFRQVWKEFLQTATYINGPALLFQNERIFGGVPMGKFQEFYLQTENGGHFEKLAEQIRSHLECLAGKRVFQPQIGDQIGLSSIRFW